MKRLFAFTLVLVMMLSLCACGGNAPADDNSSDTTTSTVEATTTTTAGAASTTTAGTTAAPTTTTTEAPTTTAPTKAPTTTSTTEDDNSDWGNWEDPLPPETTTTAVDNRPEIKILSIGHSFSVDAMHTYMPELFHAAGYKATIGYLYYPGCSLERQYHYITENRPQYERYAKSVDNGGWDTQYNVRAITALYDEDWDIVTFQPSPDFGAGTMTYDCSWGCNKKVNDYDHFNYLVSYVKTLLTSKNNPQGPNTDVKFYYHLTWAFSKDCDLWSYGLYHQNDQMNMYNAFWAATKKYVVPNKNILGVIPCITSVQNARTSFMGDTLNEPDGYHLNDKGDLLAAMTWVAYFTGKDAMDFKIGCRYSDAEYAAIAEAVDNAIKTPEAITESTHKGA